MLKILINNEEVVSDKNFTIKKEMLNTPSVILNNVYPKTWEEDKDYVSRFYHPNDYSKCKISDDTYHPEEPGITVEDTNFSIEVDTTKEYDFQSFKGQTTQNGTPTPSSPIPIEVVSGRQDVVVCGKNLYSRDNGQYNVPVYATNGTSASYPDVNVVWIKVKPSTDYSFTLLPNTQQYFVRIIQCDSNKGFIVRETQLNSSSSQVITRTKTLRSNCEWLQIAINQYQTSQIAQNNWEVMIEKGSSPTTYEAYKGNTYEINLGKNLFDKDNLIANRRFDSSGVLITDNSYSATDFISVNPSTLYSLQRTTTTGGSSCYCLYDANQNFISRQFTQTKSLWEFTTTASTYYVRIAEKTSYLDVVQFEKGQATTYAPYKTPIELCKIGTYQDRIFHNIPSNPYYDSTLNEGSWYLYKEIGKIVLNGSENWGKIDMSNSPDYKEFYCTTYDSLITWNLRDGYSNYFENYGRTITPSVIVNSSVFSIGGDNSAVSGKMRIAMLSTIASTSATFKTWLTTHNTTIYYQLANPTYTEIEDSELISQLESIELLNGLNNIGISTPYLPFIMTLLYNHVDAWTESDLLFCGVVKNSGNISLNPREPHYQTLQILDFKTFLSEGETLDFVIYQKTIREAIEQVVSSISEYGFIVGEVKLLNPDEIIGAYSTKDKSAYDVLNYIADITQSRWTTRMIDENTVAIDFYDPTLMEQGTSINYTQEWFSEYKIDNMYYSYGSNDYRNKQVMTSNNVYSNITQTQTIVANGYQTQFNTELPIGKIESIKINDVEYSFSTNQEKEMGYIADFYYTPGNNYFESANSITVGTSIVISYVSIVEGRQVITNPTEIDRVNNATGRKGVVARYETRNDAITSNELQLIGQSYIKYKGIPEVILTVQTRNNIWEVGQRVPFNAPIQELTGEYMVRSKTINRVLANPSTEDIIFYTYEMTSSFNSETAINYFDNQRAKANGNIGEGEYISRNIDIESVANIIFYDTEATEIAIVGDNILEAILEAPFVE